MPRGPARLRAVWAILGTLTGCATPPTTYSDSERARLDAALGTCIEPTAPFGRETDVRGTATATASVGVFRLAAGGSFERDTTALRAFRTTERLRWLDVVLWRLCEAAANGWITPGDFVGMFRGVLEKWTPAPAGVPLWVAPRSADPGPE